MDSLPTTTPPQERAWNWTAAGRLLKAQAVILGSFVLFIWFLEIVDVLLFRGALDVFGVRPRTRDGLLGILFMPFLHNGLGHVLANTLPFLILGWLVMLRRISTFLAVSCVVIFVSGFGVWLLGPAGSVHLGASGLIFGYFGFLLVGGLFERSLFSIVLTILVGLFYGGLLWGVLPQGAGVSWQAHLFGFMSGVMAAYFLADRRSNFSDLWHPDKLKR
ncbi:MAG: rhomboid family intramembrane serine protease [Chloroflexi bacterium]|nr:rhomboid family intramembrane serine protease [Chloroflexota bacterium]MCI0578223.1 rhomboid family intramembrane serine protease [Chloroflexota bacterium]MCI0645284.1 rhomboid family intramembrane serine protease [Chloroflexota bacterium]MCI0729562.1 rhomboid family intramembrane serine protease [Chloroflexota bacterium]